MKFSESASIKSSAHSQRYLQRYGPDETFIDCALKDVRGAGQTVFALKRFLVREERSDFAKECQILEALAVKDHPHIVYCLYSWAS